MALDIWGNFRKQRAVLLAVFLTYCTCGVASAALASLQNVCWDQGSAARALVGVSSFSAAVLDCSKVYRYWWYVATLQHMVLTGVLIDAFVTGLRRTQASWMGVFAVASLLYISMTEAFLSAESTATFTDRNDKPYPKGRTMTAGCVMTCVMNVLLVILLGIEKVKEPVKPLEDGKVEAATI